MFRGRDLPTLCLFVAAIAAAVAVAAWQQARGENTWGNAGWQQFQHALSVCDGSGFGRTHPFGFHANLFLRPVYTLFLVPFAAVFSTEDPLLRLTLAAAQGALNAGSGLAAGWVLVRAGEIRAATVARWACALGPFLVSQAATVVDTTIFALLLAATWALVVRAAARPTLGTWALAGLGLGLAVLTRSTALALVPVALLRMRDVRPPLREWVRWGLAFGGAAFLVLVPWFVRNHALTDRWMLSTVDGVNVWMGNNENTARFLDEARSLDELPGREPFDALAAITVADQLRAYDDARDAASRWMRDHPGEAASLAQRKARLLWTLRPYPRTTRSSLHGTKEVVSFAWTVAVYRFGIAGAFTAFRSPRFRPVVRDVIVVAFVFTLPHALAWSGTRLRAPLEPFLLALAAAGAAAAWSRLRPRKD